MCLPSFRLGRKCFAQLSCGLCATRSLLRAWPGYVQWLCAVNTYQVKTWQHVFCLLFAHWPWTRRRLCAVWWVKTIALCARFIHGSYQLLTFELAQDETTVNLDLAPCQWPLRRWTLSERHCLILFYVNFLTKCVESTVHLLLSTKIHCSWQTVIIREAVVCMFLCYFIILFHSSMPQRV